MKKWGVWPLRLPSRERGGAGAAMGWATAAGGVGAAEGAVEAELESISADYTSQARDRTGEGTGPGRGLGGRLTLVDDERLKRKEKEKA